MEGDSGQVGLESGRGQDDFARLACVRAELPGERPVAADIRGIDAQVQPGIALDRVDLPQLLDRIDDEPFDPLRRRAGDEIPRLGRIRVEDVGRRHAERNEEVELGDGGDLEPGAFLKQRLARTFRAMKAEWASTR